MTFAQNAPALIALSRRYGADSAFILAGGGNTSYKTADRLYVKASGHALATISADGFVELDRHALNAMLHADWPAEPKAREALFIERLLASRVHPELNPRPSVETLLHHLLPDAFVVHTHPTTLNALTCTNNGEQLARDLLGPNILWQPYVDPGLTLAQSLNLGLADHRKRTNAHPAAILLANHGLIISGATPEQIEATTSDLVAKIEHHLDQTPATSGAVPYPVNSGAVARYAEAIRKFRPHLSIVTDTSALVQNFLATSFARDAVTAGPLTPDHIVYCRSFPLWLDPSESVVAHVADAWASYEREFYCEPWIALIPGGGLLAFRDTPKLADISRALFRDAITIYQNAARLHGIHPMTPAEYHFIENWEVEAFRRAVAKG